MSTLQLSFVVTLRKVNVFTLIISWNACLILQIVVMETNQNLVIFSCVYLNYSMECPSRPSICCHGNKTDVGHIFISVYLNYSMECLSRPTFCCLGHQAELKSYLH